MYKLPSFPFVAGKPSGKKEPRTAQCISSRLSTFPLGFDLIALHVRNTSLLLTVPTEVKTFERLASILCSIARCKANLIALCVWHRHCSSFPYRRLGPRLESALTSSNPAMLVRVSRTRKQARLKTAHVRVDARTLVQPSALWVK